jgi:hypothetical protein
VRHAAALGAHTCLLVLLKGAADARGSLLHADKRQHGFAAACDGPGRGGTCDAAAWDAVYLASFWAENTLGWLCFHAHWRSLASFGAFASAGCALSEQRFRQGLPFRRRPQGVVAWSGLAL